MKKRKKPKHVHQWWFDQPEIDGIAYIRCISEGCDAILMEMDNVDVMRDECKRRGIKVEGAIKYERTRSKAPRRRR